MEIQKSKSRTVTLKELIDGTELKFTAKGRRSVEFLVGVTNEGKIKHINLSEGDGDALCVPFFKIILCYPEGYTIFPINRDLRCYVGQSEITLETNLLSGSTIEIADKCFLFIDGPLPKQHRRQLPPTPGLLVTPTPPPKPRRLNTGDFVPSQLNLDGTATDAESAGPDLSSPELALSPGWCNVDVTPLEADLILHSETPEELASLATSCFNRQVLLYTDGKVSMETIDEVFQLFLEKAYTSSSILQQFLLEMYDEQERQSSNAAYKPVHGPAIRLMVALMQISLEPESSAILCLQMLRTFSHFPDNLLTFVSCQATSVILGSMAVYINTSVIQQCGLDILAKLATYRPQLGEKIPVRETSVEFIVRAMKQHCKDLDVIRPGCRSLANLCTTIFELANQIIDNTDSKPTAYILDGVKKYESVLEHLMTLAIPLVKTILVTFGSDLGVKTEGRRLLYVYAQIAQLQQKINKWKERGLHVPKLKIPEEATITDLVPSPENPDSMGSDALDVVGILKSAGSYENLRTNERKVQFDAESLDESISSPEMSYEESSKSTDSSSDRIYVHEKYGIEVISATSFGQIDPIPNSEIHSETADGGDTALTVSVSQSGGALTSQDSDNVITEQSVNVPQINISENVLQTTSAAETCDGHSHNGLQEKKSSEDNKEKDCQDIKEDVPKIETDMTKAMICKTPENTQSTEMPDSSSFSNNENLSTTNHDATDEMNREWIESTESSICSTDDTVDMANISSTTTDMLPRRRSFGLFVQNVREKFLSTSKQTLASEANISEPNNNEAKSESEVQHMVLNTTKRQSLASEANIPEPNNNDMKSVSEVPHPVPKPRKTILDGKIEQNVENTTVNPPVEISSLEAAKRSKEPKRSISPTSDHDSEYSKMVKDTMEEKAVDELAKTSKCEKTLQINMVQADKTESASSEGNKQETMDASRELEHQHIVKSESGKPMIVQSESSKQQIDQSHSILEQLDQSQQGKQNYDQSNSGQNNNEEQLSTNMDRENNFNSESETNIMSDEIPPPLPPRRRKMQMNESQEIANNESVTPIEMALDSLIQSGHFDNMDRSEAFLTGAGSIPALVMHSESDISCRRQKQKRNLSAVDIVMMTKLVRHEIVCYVCSMVLQGEDPHALQVIDQPIISLLSDAKSQLEVMEFAKLEYDEKVTLMDIDPSLVISIIDAVRYNSLTISLLQDTILELLSCIKQTHQKDIAARTFVCIKKAFGTESLKTVLKDEKFVARFRERLMQLIPQLQEKFGINDLRESLSKLLA